MFPEPGFSPTWQQATQFVNANAQGAYPPAWNESAVLYPGAVFTDPKNGITSVIPGNDKYIQLKRDPYGDLVYLARDLGVAGVDIDYEVSDCDMREQRKYASD